MGSNGCEWAVVTAYLKIDEFHCWSLHCFRFITLRPALPHISKYYYLVHGGTGQRDFGRHSDIVAYRA